MAPRTPCPLSLPTGCPVFPPLSGLCPNGNRCPYQASYSSPAQVPNQGPGTFTQQARTQGKTLLAQYAAFLAGQGAGAPGLMNLALGSFTTVAPPSWTFGLKPEPLPLPLKPAEITVGELIGWRIWRLTSDFQLQSYAFDIGWPYDKPMESNAPVTDHGHAGIWAFKDQAQAHKKLEIETALDFTLGSVLLWGDVIEHEIGYRAQFARVRSIDLLRTGIKSLDPTPASILTSLRLRYCPRSP